jgi:hypothetical protein
VKTFLFVIYILISNNIFAKEEILATVTNDENKDIYKIVIASDENTGDVKTFYKDNYTGTSRVSRTALDYKSLPSSAGLVLEQRKEYRVIALQSNNFDNVRGGIINVDTLYNGASGQRKSYELSIAKDRTGWKLFKGNSSISKLHIEVNKIALLGTVGVKNIRME